MKKNFSLRQRFLFLSSILLLGLIFSSTFILERVYHRTQINSQKQNAQAQLNLLIASTELSSDNVFQVDIEKLPESFFNGQVIALVQNSENFETLWQSSPANLGELPKSFLGLGNIFFKKLRPFNEKKRFIASLPMQWQVTDDLSYNITFTILPSAKKFLRQQAYFRFRAIISILILGCLFIILQYIFIHLGFTPIKNIGKAIDNIRKGRNDTINSDRVPKELLPMTQSLNLLLNHQKNINTANRQAADDLAHTLKTPLTGLKSHIELLDATQSSQKSQLSQLVDQANDLIERKLSLLKQQHQSVFLKAILLKPIINSVVRALSKSTLKSIQHEINIDEALKHPIHPDDLYELMGNLMENAFKYAKSTAIIIGHVKNNHLTIIIKDDGPGFPTKNPMQLLARGKRLDEQSSGTGLGLYISQQIVLRYKGKIELSNDDGASIKITLPINP